MRCNFPRLLLVSSAACLLPIVLISIAHSTTRELPIEVCMDSDDALRFDWFFPSGSSNHITGIAVSQVEPERLNPETMWQILETPQSGEYGNSYYPGRELNFILYGKAPDSFLTSHAAKSLTPGLKYRVAIKAPGLLGVKFFEYPASACEADSISIRNTTSWKWVR